MKILHVITSLSAKQGGTSAAVHSMAQAVAKSGVTVHVASTDDNGSEGHLSVPLAQPIKEKDVTYWYFRRQTKFYGFSLPLTLWLSRHVYEYDIVHAHGLFIYSSLPATYYARLYGIPYVVTMHGVLNEWGMTNRRARVKKFMLPMIEKPLVLSRAALLHFTCEQEQLEARRVNVGMNEPSVVVPLGINFETFQELPSPEHFLSDYPQLQGQKIVLFLSRIDPVKGLDLLLTAFAAVQREYPNTTLVIAGSGPANLIAQLKNTALNLDIQQKVIWAGFLTGAKKLAALAAADLFVLPSFSENFGVSVVEAMAANLPIVISDRVGMHREVKQYSAGYITSCTVDDLAASIKLLLSNTALRQQIGNTGRQVAAEKFSLESMASGLIKAYERILR